MTEIMTEQEYRFELEEAEYLYLKSLDYSKITDYKILFSSQKEYIKALLNRTNPFHTEAMQIRKNRQSAGLLKPLSETKSDCDITDPRQEEFNNIARNKNYDTEKTNTN